MNRALLHSIPLLLLLVPLAPAARAADTVVAIGATPVRLPAPDGFTEVGQGSPEIMARFTTFTPPSNKLLAVYVTNADAERLRKGQQMDLSSYIMVQTHRRSLEHDMSQAEFDQLRDIIRNQQQQLLEQGRKRANELLKERRSQISSQTGANTQLSVQDMALKGVFIDNPRTISLAAVNTYNVQVEGQPSSFEVAGTSSVIYVKNKSLFVYVFEKYEGSRNLENIRDISITWGRQILGANGAR
jgi:hypothetical protein